MADHVRSADQSERSVFPPPSRSLAGHNHGLLWLRIAPPRDFAGIWSQRLQSFHVPRDRYGGISLSGGIASAAASLASALVRERPRQLGALRLVQADVTAFVGVAMRQDKTGRRSARWRGELREVVRPLPSSFLSAFLFRCSVIVLPTGGDPYANSCVATLVLSYRLAPAEPADPVRPGAWPL